MPFNVHVDVCYLHLCYLHLTVDNKYWQIPVHLNTPPSPDAPGEGTYCNVSGRVRKAGFQRQILMAACVKKMLLAAG